MQIRIGIDIGGTFTDFVVYQPITGCLETSKLLTTSQDPSQAVMHGLRRILASYAGQVNKTSEQPGVSIIHGTTVATNALLERKGARTALVTTQGFGDVLQIGRQDRPALYDWTASPLPPLVPAKLRFEVAERVERSGGVVKPLDLVQVESLLSRLRAQGVVSVAICLLFSFLHPEHEQAIAWRLREAGFFVSASCEVLPEYREYERMSTTAVNAYVSPVLDGYLANLEDGLGNAVRQGHLRVMQSNGGVLSPGEARRNAVRCILSGPAGGVVGATHIAGQIQVNKLITFDMGGTSTDVSLIDGAPQVTTEAVIGGCPIRIPLLDIHTIGAGGGSIAALDQGGALRVGPQSAGADPGPACYGRGSLPTVTDANLVVGRLLPEQFLGGAMRLEAERAFSALSGLGASAGLDAYQAALGVIEVINAHMERALRVISVERGHDPRDFSLLSFGGAGGLHAADLARRMGIPRVLVPPLASTLSAFGMLAAEVVRDYTLTVMLPGATPVDALEGRLAPLVEKGLEDVQVEGIALTDIRVERFLDMRYVGQSYELIVPFSGAVIEDFHRLHAARYGYSIPGEAVEVVNLRVRAVGRVEPPVLASQPLAGVDPTPALLDTRGVVFHDGIRQVPFYRGESLQPGNRLSGPAVVLRSDTTILVGPSDRAEVDPFGNLSISVGAQ